MEQARQESMIKNEMHLIQGGNRWSKVTPSEINNYPPQLHWVDLQVSREYQHTSHRRLVLTSAHNLSYNPKPSQISFGLIQKDPKNPVILKIRSYKVSPQYQQITTTINDLQGQYHNQKNEVIKKQMYQKINQMHYREIQYDFALLELEEQVQSNRYFELPQNSESFLMQTTVFGYAQAHNFNQYCLCTHFEPFLKINHRVFYNIDPMGGQSGSPTYLIARGSAILIGINQGYQGEENINYCTVISQQIVAILKQWIIEMKESLSAINLINKDLSNQKDLIGFKSQIVGQSSERQILIASMKRNEEKLTEIAQKNKIQFTQHQTTIKVQKEDTDTDHSLCLNDTNQKKRLKLANLDVHIEDKDHNISFLQTKIDELTSKCTKLQKQGKEKEANLQRIILQMKKQSEQIDKLINCKQ